MASKPRIIPPFVVGDAKNKWMGLNTAVKDNRFLNRGEAFEQNNWITGRDQDHIELRRGSFILGSAQRNIANAVVTGIGIGIKNDGTQIPFFSYLQKILYYDPIADNTIEIGTNLLPAAALGDNTNFMPYQNLAGSYVYLTSKNSGIYKISVANLGSYVDLASTDFHFGFAKINRGSMFGMNRRGNAQNSNDVTGVYLSVPDSIANNSTDLGFFVANGNGVTKTFSGTITLTAPNTAYFVTITDGVETFTDNKNGLLIGSLGGTGTINYITGAYSVTFNTAPVAPTTYTATTISTVAPHTIHDSAGGFPIFAPGSIIRVQGTSLSDGVYKVVTSTITDITIYETLANSDAAGPSVTISRPIGGLYYQENSLVTGVANFTGTGSDTFRQDDGGGIAEAVWPFNGVEYCFHQLRSWQLTIDVSTTPVSFDNQPYFEQIGIPGIHGAFPTGDGILFLNNALPSQPKVSILSIPPGSTNLTVVPQSLSDALDLSSYGIDNIVVFRWGDYDVVSLQNQVNGMTSSFNGVTFIRNIVSGLWNQLDFFINCAADYNGQLIAGSSISPNVFKLFYGFNDSGTTISNIHKQALTNLEIEGLKKVGYINFSGLIQKGQKLDIFITLDNGAYTKVFTIDGNASYVSSTIITVGSQGIGVGTVGGGFDNEPVYASRYEVDIPIHTGLFEYIGWAVQATSFGFVSVERQEWKDTRFKRRRLLSYEDSEIDNS